MADIRISADCQKKESELCEIEKEIALFYINTSNVSDDNIRILRDKKEKVEQEYYELKKERERNLQMGERTEANECYFILKSKLNNIEEAAGVLSQLEELHGRLLLRSDDISKDVKWVEQNTDLLMEAYSCFANKYAKL